MWIEKLVHGLLEIATPIGPRYVQPSFVQRAYLLWTFRNFPSLPQQVMHSWEQRLIDRLWSDQSFVAISITDGPEQPVIGRVERRTMPQLETVPMRKPVTSTQPAVVEQGREASAA